MKKDDEADEMLPEYDFRHMTGGVRGKFAAAYQRGTNLARLDPDVAQAFTTDEGSSGCSPSSSSDSSSG